MDTGGYIGKAQKAMRVDLTLDGGILLSVPGWHLACRTRGLAVSWAVHLAACAVPRRWHCVCHGQSACGTLDGAARDLEQVNTCWRKLLVAATASELS